MTFYINRASSAVKTINSNINTIPWEECWKVYIEAADNAEESALADAKTAYDLAYEQRRRDAIRNAGIDESEAAYEGDLNLDYTAPELDPELKTKLRNKAGNDAIAEYFIKPYQLKSWGIRVLDQILSDFSKHKLNNLGSDGKISGLEYLKQNLDPKSDRDRGIYRFLMLDSRSDYLEKMGTGEAKKYCTLVPLILYAHKLYNNVEYSQWERETLSYVVNPALHEAMLSEVPEIPVERLIELRDAGLIKAGKPMSPASSYGLYRLGQTELGHLNKLAQMMKCQTWAAHPTNRTKYMVLDPMNWDSMPPSLINVSLFTKQPDLIKPTTVTKSTDNVWG